MMLSSVASGIGSGTHDDFFHLTKVDVVALACYYATTILLQ